MRFLIFSILINFFCITAYSQNLDSILQSEEDTIPERTMVDATFKTSRIVQNHSIENPPKNEMYVSIAHRFGLISDGYYELYGIDETSNIRIGFEYGISDRLAIGLGRSKFEKSYDGFLKYRIIRQQTGERNIPFSISVLIAATANTLKWEIPERNNLQESRFDYCYQLLLASKLSKRISIQLMPGYIHRNLVKYRTDENDVYSLGIGGRIKITKRLSLNVDYTYLLSPEIAKTYKNPFAIGLDIETGGHIFQIIMSNSYGINDKSFITQTQNSWLKGNIHIGFTLFRLFSFGKK